MARQVVYSAGSMDELNFLRNPECQRIHSVRQWKRNQKSTEDILTVSSNSTVPGVSGLLVPE